MLGSRLLTLICLPQRIEMIEAGQTSKEWRDAAINDCSFLSTKLPIKCWNLIRQFMFIEFLPCWGNSLTKRAREMGEENVLPIVSICVIADRNKAPPAFTPILKTYDEGADADLWKDGGWGLFNRTVRYLATSRTPPPDTAAFEVVNDIAIIDAKEAVPIGFICVDFTADSKEKALRKKYLGVRFLPRNDAMDAVTDIILLSKQKRPPRGYTSAGEIDGLMICYKQTPIAETYGRLPHSQSNPSTLYPNIPAPETRHSTTDLDKMNHQVNAFTIKTPNATVKGIDGVPFKLNPKYANDMNKAQDCPLPELQEPRWDRYQYNFMLERSIVS